MKGFFVTGTDTGVGKTFVTAALARRARELGKKVFAFKPVETGCERVGEGLVGSDQEIIAEAAGNWQTGPLRGVYQLASPVAPLVAAEREGRTLDLDLMVRTARQGAELVDLTLVEGAGGWRVPVTADADIGALALRVGLPIVVVARATLGTVNHSLLTVETIERDGGKVAGLVLSRRPEDGLEFAQCNVEQISRRWKGRVLVYDTNPAVLDRLLA